MRPDSSPSDPDPWGVFNIWMAEAQVNPLFNPETVALATVSVDDHKPSLRMVYYRGIREGGLSFFTNFDSKKGTQILENPQAALLFYWPHLGRQLRVEGYVARLSCETSNNYFIKRPRESQITAWVSKQSRRLRSFTRFENELRDFARINDGEELSRPPHWGGYKLDPDLFEFWSGQSHRRHKRTQFRKLKDGWMSHLLYP
ncbi:MAG: pyridoxamine 5'-phosphate oxidase [Bdellovibrionales bacterium]